MILKNKKGQVTLFLMLMIFVAFVMIILLGIATFATTYVVDSLSLIDDVGNISINASVQDSLGQVNTGFLAVADQMGIFLIFGMALGLLGSAFFFRGMLPRVFIVLDIFIIILTVIVAVYLSNSYETLINAIDSTIPDFKSVIPKSSTFILNLPEIVIGAGIFIIILGHIVIPRRRRDEETLSFDY